MKRKILILSSIVIILLIILLKFYFEQPSLSQEKILKIKKGESAFSIGEKLKKEGLIKNKYVFLLYAFFTGKARELKAGTYKLHSSMSIPEIISKLAAGETLKIKITIPEGLTLKEIEEKLRTINPKINLSQFSIKDFKKDFPLLKEVPDNASLEGFLFPDTYYFEAETPEREIVLTFLKNFEKKLRPRDEEIKRQGKTLFDILIVASLIEKEVSKKEDRKLVSGILWKRLKHNIPLQVDATITYITGKKTTKISFEETKIDHPYNTYLYKGLPPGPICNPGLESILAAIYPKESNYWYYLSTPQGETIFNENLKGHNLAKTKYLK